MMMDRRPWLTFSFTLFCSLITANICSTSLPPLSSSSVERTLAMVKPDAFVANHTDAIKTIVRSSGFRIAAEKVVQLEAAGAQTFYAEHSSRDFFPDLIKFMTSSPVLAMVLEKKQAVDDWRALIGPTDPMKAKKDQPTSIRAMYGRDVQRNCVHGSDSLEAAAREIAFFFEVEQTGNISLTVHDEL